MQLMAWQCNIKALPGHGPAVAKQHRRGPRAVHVLAYSSATSHGARLESHGGESISSSESVHSSSSSSSSNGNSSQKAVAALQPSVAKAALHAPAACRVRPVENDDYWAAADLHCSAFYPRAMPFWFSLLRVDRVMAIQQGRERVTEFGNYQCLVAEGGALSGSSSSQAESEESDASSAALPAGPATLEEAVAAAAEAVRRAAPKTATGSGKGDRVDLGPLVDMAVSLFFPPFMRLNYATAYEASRLRGVAVVDAWGEQVPRKRKEMINGTVRQVRRKGIAYLSNLAVAPCARRTGVGRMLLHEAEQTATGWGCCSIALHVDPTNTAAMELYLQAGYRRVLEQPEWQRMLEGRQKPLMLMMRTLKRRAAGEAASQAASQAGPSPEQQQQQAGTLV